MLYVEALGGIAQLVLDGTCRIGVSSHLPQFPAGLTRHHLTNVAMLCVTGATHPLAKHKGPIPAKTLHQHVQLVLADRTPLTQGVDLGVHEGPTWRLADLGAKHEFLRAGFGWGGMPLHLVADDIEAGRLVYIAPQEWSAGPLEVPLYGIHRADDLPGRPATGCSRSWSRPPSAPTASLARLATKCSQRKGSRSKA